MTRSKEVLRADARRNVDAVLEGARDVFRTSGVDAPVRDIAARSGVGVATVYRHFPQRSDLVAAVYRREVDQCAAAAATLARDRKPFDALAAWLGRYTSFIATKRGLSAALHSADPAFDLLPGYFRARLEPALRSLLDAAITAGTIRDDVNAYELLQGVGILSLSSSEEGHRAAKRMIELALDGLRRPATDLITIDQPGCVRELPASSTDAVRSAIGSRRYQERRRAATNATNVPASSMRRRSPK